MTALLESSPSIADWLDRALLVAALGLAAALTTGPCIHSPLGIDEQVTYYLAWGKTPSSVMARCLDESATPPLFFWLVNGSMRIGSWFSEFRPAEFWVRFPAWLAFLASIVAIFRMGRSWFGPGCGGAAALMLAGYPLAIDFATQARPYSLGLLLSLIAVGLLVRLRAPGWRPIHLIGFFLANAALPWTHYLFVVLLPAEALLLALLPASAPAEDALPGDRPPLPRQALGVFLFAVPLTMVPLVSGIFQLMENGEYLNWTTDTRAWHQQLDILEWRPLLWTLPAGFLILLLRLTLNRVRGADSAIAPEQKSPLAHESSAHEPSANAPSSTIVGEPTAHEPTSRIGGEPLAHEPLAPVFQGRGEGVRGSWSSNASPLLGLRAPLLLLTWLLVPLYTLWFAAGWSGSSLAQLRYAAPLVAPAVLLFVWLFHLLAGPRLVGALAILFVCTNGVPHRLVDVLRNPVRHDTFWLDAANILDDRADPGDLVFVQSGLVETILTPIRFADEGFQEYTTSRLSSYYLDVDVERLTLPLQWIDGEWLTSYNQKIDHACQTGRGIWLVLSADSDIGANSQAAALNWLTRRGLTVKLISDQRVARIFEARCPE